MHSKTRQKLNVKRKALKIVGDTSRVITCLHMPGDRHRIHRIIQRVLSLSDTAAKATKWIGINPGTEGALALGLAYVIIKESLYDKNFVENYAFGFNDWTDDNGTTHAGFATMVRNFAPEKVAQITGIDKAEIVSLARAFARASKPIAINGRGQGDVPGSLDESLAVQSLNALVVDMVNLTQSSGADQVFYSREFRIQPGVPY